MKVTEFMAGVPLQDVLRNWYARLPAIVQNTNALVSNAEACAQAFRQGKAAACFGLRGLS